jgi:hypothetical protein
LGVVVDESSDRPKQLAPLSQMTIHKTQKAVKPKIYANMKCKDGGEYTAATLRRRNLGFT